MATYPGAIYNPTTLVDESDYPQATHINTPNGEIVAIETELGTDVAGTSSDLKTRLAVSLAGDGDLTLTDASTLTIASGVVTATRNYHKIDTESSAAADDLDTINGGSSGMLLVLRAANSSRVVRVKHLTGNIALPGGQDMYLASDDMYLMLIYDSAASEWKCVGFGRQMAGYLSKSSAYTVTKDDAGVTILANAVGAGFTVTLPVASGAAGMSVTVVKVDSSANAVVVAANTAEDINGDGSQTLGYQYDSLTVVCNGTGWFIVSDTRKRKLRSVTTSSSTYAASVENEIILADASAAGITVNLPAAANSAGAYIAVKKIDTSANAVVLDGNSSETIDKASTAGTSTAYAIVRVYCDGTEWWTL